MKVIIIIPTLNEENSIEKLVYNLKEYLKQYSVLIVDDDSSDTTQSQIIKLKKNDTVIDIGSNDGTFLNCFNSDKFKLIGVDPSIINFKKFYKKSHF